MVIVYEKYVIVVLRLEVDWVLQENWKRVVPNFTNHPDFYAEDPDCVLRIRGS